MAYTRPRHHNRIEIFDEFVAPTACHFKHGTCMASRPWRCDRAVRDDINGKKGLATVAKLEVVRASMNQWLR